MRSNPIRLLWVGGATAVLAMSLLAARSGAAPAPPPPATPVGEDVAFVMLAAVGERVGIDFYRSAARQRQLDPEARDELRRIAKRKAKSWGTLNAALGEDALVAGDIAVSLPAEKLETPKGTVRFGERIERLLAGVYLSGVRDVVDPSTRLLLARQLLASVRDLTALRSLRGAHGAPRPPAPIGVRFAGVQFDRFLTAPGVEPG